MTYTDYTWNNMSRDQTDAVFQQFSEELVTLITFLVPLLLSASASSMSVNMNKGINALRCAGTSLFANLWMPIGAAYWALK